MTELSKQEKLNQCDNALKQLANQRFTIEMELASGLATSEALTQMQARLEQIDAAAVKLAAFRKNFEVV